MHRLIPVVLLLLMPAAAAWGQGFSNPLSIVIPLPRNSAPPDTAPTPAKSLTIGLLLTLSGPEAEPGRHARDGFLLALRQRGGRLGGRVVQLLVLDDGSNPDAAAIQAKRLVEQDGAEFVVGPVFGPVLDAIFKPVTSAGAMLISPNAVTAAVAGKGCSPNFFATSYAESQVEQALGQVAQDLGLKRVFMIAPDSQQGRDAVAAFRSRFKNEPVEQVAVPAAQTDFQPDIVRLAAAKPDIVFAYMPGAQGVALIKQFRASGLASSIPMLSAFTVDESTMPGQNGTGVGVFGAMTWAPDIGTPANAQFTAAFEDVYGYVPSVYAMNGFDAAQLIDSAVAKTAARPVDKDALRAALREADFKSPRGLFRFNVNGLPVQDFYLVQATQRGDGKFMTRIRQRVFTDYPDGFVGACGLR